MGEGRPYLLKHHYNSLFTPCFTLLLYCCLQVTDGTKLALKEVTRAMLRSDGERVLLQFPKDFIFHHINDINNQIIS